MQNAIKVGDRMYWDRNPVVVTKVGLPTSDYGDAIEVRFEGSYTVMETVPGLDHRLTSSPDEVKPSLSSLLYG